MSEKIIMLSVVAAAVAAIAALFIRRALRYRKVMEAAVAEVVEEETSLEVQPTVFAAEDIYRLRFISLWRIPFTGGKSVCIRPEYHARIKKIKKTIGDNDVTIGAYVDNVLKAHFDDNRVVINDLYDKKLDELSGTTA